jgi:ABC-type lipoprotein release transport system permease subunit
MRLSYYIAKRYLFSKGNRNAINIITGISVLVVSVSVSALIIVLSSINGFGKLINEQISIYAPDLRIEASRGKTFKFETGVIQNLKAIPGITSLEEVLEDNILVKYEDRQLICTVKGVSENYSEIYPIKESITQGVFKTEGDFLNYCVLGAGIAYQLGVSVMSGQSISIWIPNRKQTNILNPIGSFNRVTVVPAGIITIDADFDSKYLLTSLSTVRAFTSRDSLTMSSMEIKVKDISQIDRVKKEIQKILGADYTVKDRYEQFEVYRVMKSERLVTFIIMLFIIFIASFSIVGSITMLIIEKKEDIFTLFSMGATIKTVRRIFFWEGILITTFGTIVGLIMGGILSYLQQEFGLVRFPADGNYIVDAYPVDVKAIDFLYAFFSVTFIGVLLSLYPSMKINKKTTGSIM